MCLSQKSLPGTNGIAYFVLQHFLPEGGREDERADEVGPRVPPKLLPREQAEPGINLIKTFRLGGNQPI